MSAPPPAGRKPAAGGWVVVALAWAAVAIPLAWGIYRTLRTAAKLF
ncbi:MAG TPA: hypothetical protein VLV45_04920 [Gemmatimonadales bacterium]|nr:hypothetical protein [Gemmatimonadales bacterium]